MRCASRKVQAERLKARFFLFVCSRRLMRAYRHARRPSRGFRGINGAPPTHRRESVAPHDQGRVSAGRGAPHLFHDPLDRLLRVAVFGRRRDERASVGAKVRRAPAGGVEQKGMAKRC